MKFTSHFRFLLISALLLMAFAFMLSPHPALASPAASPPPQKIAIPSYFYPGPLWTKLESGAPTVGLAIINPNSGPGSSRDPAYAAEIQRAHAKGIIVLGYVHTSNGARSAYAVKSEVNRYYAWYQIDGIFFDEANVETCAQKPYYLSLYNYVKAKGGAAKVVINPGTNIPECYIATADIILNFEDTYSAYVHWQPSGWEVKYPASRFWHLVIGTPQSKLGTAIALSKGRHAGWVYVTPDVLPNPWDTLPPSTYWTSELNLAKQ
jgi:hypothetical protein